MSAAKELLRLITNLPGQQQTGESHKLLSGLVIFQMTHGKGFATLPVYYEDCNSDRQM
jgi:hypothetical protein